MFQYGAQNKAKLCALWEYAPFRTKVAALLGRPIEALGGVGRSAILDAMGRMSPHEWRAALFEGTYYDVYVMASYHGGCDLYMRSPTDRPMQAWWRYKARKMAADPTLWWTMPLNEPQFVSIGSHPEWTDQLRSRLINIVLSA